MPEAEALLTVARMRVRTRLGVKCHAAPRSLEQDDDSFYVIAGLLP
jgi:hypothetical protein